MTVPLNVIILTFKLFNTVCGACKLYCYLYCSLDTPVNEVD